MRSLAIAAAAGAVVLAQSQPAFRTATRLVEVSVVVHDRNGKPVEGLTAADFKVTDDGDAQAIEFFSVLDEGRSFDSGPGPQRLALDRIANEFTNWRDGQRSSVTVILIDRINSTDADQIVARKQIVKLLETLGPRDRVALYLLESSRIRILHDFTTDTSALLRSLARYRARSNGDPDGVRSVGPAIGDPDIDAFLEESRVAEQGRANRSRAQITAAGLETLGQHLSGIRGRKNLIWVTSAFPLVSRDELGKPITFNTDATRAMRMLSDGNIAVYPVDDRGIPAYWVIDPAAPTALVGQTVTNAASAFASTSPNDDTMQMIADATGGRAYRSNDIARAIRRAMDDSAITYVLGYYPSQNKWNDRFHRITVNVTRPGMNLRHRSGYFASNALPTLALMTTARSPLEATGLRLSARVDGAASQLSATIRLEPGGLVLTKKGDKWESAVEILIAQSTPSGTFSRTFENTLHLQFSDEQHDQVVAEGLSVTRSIAVQTGAHQLHVVMRDTTTGATGSLTVPLR